MSYTQQYVELDGDFHALADDPNHTACGKDVPYNSPYAPLADGEVAHCYRLEEDEPEPKPKKAKKAKGGDEA